MEPMLLLRRLPHCAARRRSRTTKSWT